MRLEGKVPSFVSALFFPGTLLRPDTGWIHLHLLCGVSQQAFQLAGLPGTLLSGLLDSSLEKTDPGSRLPDATNEAVSVLFLRYIEGTSRFF